MHYPDEWITSNRLANSINVHPVIVRKEISTLKNNHLIKSKEGKNGGIKLDRHTKNILLSEIFRLVMGSDHVFGYCKNESNPTCSIGKKMNTNLSHLYSDLDTKLDESLSKITLENFKEQFN